MAKARIYRARLLITREYPMRFTVGLAPVQISDGTDAIITVGNSGTVPVTLSSGGKAIHPGFSRTVHTGGVAVTATTGVVTTTTLEVDSALVADTGASPVKFADLATDVQDRITELETLPVSTDAAVGATKTISTAYPLHRLTLGANSEFTIAATAGKRLALLLTQGVGAPFTVTWPASVRWAGGTAPNLSDTGTDLVELVCIDGTHWEGQVTLDLQVPA